MKGRIHGEDDSEKNESSEDSLCEIPFELHPHRDSNGDHGEGNSPSKSSCGRAANIALFLGNGGSGGLHDTVSDNPDRHEGTDGGEIPTELGAEENGEGHHEPNVAGGKEEESRKGQDVNFA